MRQAPNNKNGKDGKEDKGPKVPESSVILMHLAKCFMDANPVALRAFKAEFEKFEPRVQQIYLSNLKKLVSEAPLFHQRANEKTYVQVMNVIKELLKNSAYQVKDTNL